MFQIDSYRVEDYLYSMNNLIDELETIVSSMKNFEEKLIWEGKAGDANKERYREIMSYEEEVCNIINIFITIYEKGLSNYGMTQEELEKEFEELKSRNNIIDEGV